MRYQQFFISILLISAFLGFSLLIFPNNTKADITNSINTPSDPLFNITLLTSNMIERYTEWAKIIEEELMNIGIGVSYHDITDVGTIYDRCEPNETGIIPTYDEGGVDMVFWSTPGVSSLDWDPDDCYYPDCLLGYQSSIMEQLDNDYHSCFDNNRRLEIVTHIQAILHEDLPQIVVCYPAGIWAYSASWNISYEDVFAIQTYGMRSGWADFSFDGYDPIIFGKPYVEHLTSVVIESPFQRWEEAIWASQPTLTFQGLYERNISDNSKWIPLLAEEMPTWSADNKSATIRLRGDVFFADGHQLTSHDIVETYRWHMTPKYDSPSYGYFKYFFGTNESIKAEDDFTIQFNFTVAYPFALELFDISIYPIHIWGNHTHPNIADYGRSDELYNNITKLKEFWIGTGPYKYKYVNFTEARIEVQAVDNYWKGEVKTQEIHFIEYRINEETYQNPNDDQAIADLKSGRVHILEREIVQNLTKIQGIEGIRYHFLPNTYNGIGYQSLDLNMFHPILGTGVKTPLGIDDPSRAGEAARYIRQAISHIIPRHRIINDSLLGAGIPGITDVTPFSLGFNDSLEPYEYSPEKARQLLKKAEYQFPASTTGPSFTTTTPTSTDGSVPSFELIVILVGMTPLGIYIIIKRYRRYLRKKCTF
jgi:ABC-type transport system substrate-binding protein